MAKNKQKAGMQRQNIGAAKGVSYTNRVPQISMKQSTTVITHRELLTEALSNPTFSAGQLKFNPGRPEISAWLNKIGGAFEKYKIRKLKFEYVPQCATTTAGTFGMYFDYDPTDGYSGNIQEFSNMYKSVMTQVWSGTVLTVDPQQMPLFTRNANLGDLKLFDYGSFNWFMLSPTTITGLVFMEYEIEFMKPHHHLEETVFTSDQVYARWNAQQAGQSPTATPSNWSSGKMIWGTGADAGKFKLVGGNDGLYEVTATVSTPANSNITQICGSARNGVVSAFANTMTEVSAIIQLVSDFFYTPFVISAGFVGANSIITLKRLTD